MQILDVIQSGENRELDLCTKNFMLFRRQGIIR